MNYAVIENNSVRCTFRTNDPTLVESYRQHFVNAVVVAVDELQDAQNLMVQNGGVVARPPAPSIFHAFDPATNQWSDRRSLSQIVASKWLALKELRDKRKVSGVKVGSLWFHSDADSRTQQLGLVMFGASLPAGLQWKTMGGAFVTMTPTLAQQVFGATAASDQAIFAKAEFHKAAMEASPQPHTYDFTVGWPLAFGE